MAIFYNIILIIAISIGFIVALSIFEDVLEKTGERVMDILYVCDQEKCDPCHPEDCKHTLYVSHAKNFRKVEVEGKVWYEEITNDD